LAVELLGTNFEAAKFEVDLYDLYGTTLNMIKNKLIDFCTKTILLPPGSFKIVIIKNLDRAVDLTQEELWMLLSSYMGSIRFFISCSDISKILECYTKVSQSFEFLKIESEEIKTHLNTISKSENFDISEIQINKIIYEADGNMRVVLDELQKTIRNVNVTRVSMQEDGSIDAKDNSNYFRGKRLYTMNHFVFKKPKYLNKVFIDELSNDLSCLYLGKENIMIFLKKYGITADDPFKPSAIDNDQILENDSFRIHYLRYLQDYSKSITPENIENITNALSINTCTAHQGCISLLCLIQYCQENSCKQSEEPINFMIPSEKMKTIILENFETYTKYVRKQKPQILLPNRCRILETEKIKELITFIDRFKDDKLGRKVISVWSLSGKGKTYALLQCYQNLKNKKNILLVNRYVDRNIFISIYNHLEKYRLSIGGQIENEATIVNFTTLNEYLITQNIMDFILIVDQMEHLKDNEKDNLDIFLNLDDRKKKLTLILASSLNDSTEYIHCLYTNIVEFEFNNSFTEVEFKELIIYHEYIGKFITSFKEDLKVDENVLIAWANNRIDEESGQFQIEEDKNGEELIDLLNFIFKITLKNPSILAYLMAIQGKKFFGDKSLIEMQLTTNLHHLFAGMNVYKDITKAEAPEIQCLYDLFINFSAEPISLADMPEDKYIDYKFIQKKTVRESYFTFTCENTYYSDFIFRYLEDYFKTNDYWKESNLYTEMLKKYKFNKSENPIMAGNYFEKAVKSFFYNDENYSWSFFDKKKKCSVNRFTNLDSFQLDLLNAVNGILEKTVYTVKDVFNCLGNDLHNVFFPDSKNNPHFDFLVLNYNTEKQELALHFNQITCNINRSKNFMTNKKFYEDALLEVYKSFKQKHREGTFILEFGWTVLTDIYKKIEAKNFFNSVDCKFYLFGDKGFESVKKSNGVKTPFSILEEFLEEKERREEERREEEIREEEIREEERREEEKNDNKISTEKQRGKGKSG
jgi:hypothetical protein